MDPDTVLEHLYHGRFVCAEELVAALATAVEQRDAARSERDSVAAVWSVAQVTT